MFQSITSISPLKVPGPISVGRHIYRHLNLTRFRMSFSAGVLSRKRWVRVFFSFHIRLSWSFGEMMCVPAGAFVLSYDSTFTTFSSSSCNILLTLAFLHFRLHHQQHVHHEAPPIPIHPPPCPRRTNTNKCPRTTSLPMRPMGLYRNRRLHPLRRLMGRVCRKRLAMLICDRSRRKQHHLEHLMVMVWRILKREELHERRLQHGVRHTTERHF